MLPRLIPISWASIFSALILLGDKHVNEGARHWMSTCSPSASLSIFHFGSLLEWTKELRWDSYFLFFKPCLVYQFVYQWPVDRCRFRANSSPGLPLKTFSSSSPWSPGMHNNERWSKIKEPRGKERNWEIKKSLEMTGRVITSQDTRIYKIDYRDKNSSGDRIQTWTTIQNFSHQPHGLIFK